MLLTGAFRKNAAPSACQELCAAILHESFAIDEEMEEGSFGEFLTRCWKRDRGRLRRRSSSTGFIGIEDTRKFLLNAG